MPSNGYAAGSGSGTSLFSGRELTVLADTAKLVSDRANAMRIGTGAPAAILADAPGRFYFRSDTPTVALQRIYVATAVGVWVGIV